MKLDFSGIINSIKANAPDILVGVGIGGVVAGTVLACVATTKVEKVLDEHKEAVDDIHKKEADGVVLSEDAVMNYREEDARKDLTRQYVKTGAKLTKLYLPSVVVLSGSIGCIVGSHVMLNTRNNALVAAYATLEGCFNDYRGAVIDKYGEDVDTELKYGLKKEKTKNGEDPKYKQVREPKRGYSALFDQVNAPGVFQEMDQSGVNYNLNFIETVYENVNRLLKTRGVGGTVCYNEVLRQLTLPVIESPEGQLMGWVNDPDKKYQIDFGLYTNGEHGKVPRPGKEDFINGRESAVWLDFNVEGYIYKK